MKEYKDIYKFCNPWREFKTARASKVVRSLKGREFDCVRM